MAEIRFEVSAWAGGSGRERGGAVLVDGLELGYSVPASMGGKGAGVSPETLLLAAVTACYALTLLALLQKRKLPVSRVEVRSEGLVSAGQHQDRYERVAVHPTIVGGDSGRREEYAAVAAQARDRCYIGRTVAGGGAAYEVGSVAVAP